MAGNSDCYLIYICVLLTRWYSVSSL